MIVPTAPNNFDCGVCLWGRVFGALGDMIQNYLDITIVTPIDDHPIVQLILLQLTIGSLTYPQLRGTRITVTSQLGLTLRVPLKLVLFITWATMTP